MTRFSQIARLALRPCCEIKCIYFFVGIFLLSILCCDVPTVYYCKLCYDMSMTTVHNCTLCWAKPTTVYIVLGYAYAVLLNVMLDMFRKFNSPLCWGMPTLYYCALCCDMPSVYYVHYVGTCLVCSTVHYVWICLLCTIVHCVGICLVCTTVEARDVAIRLLCTTVHYVGMCLALVCTTVHYVGICLSYTLCWDMSTVYTLQRIGICLVRTTLHLWWDMHTVSISCL